MVVAPANPGGFFNGVTKIMIRAFLKDESGATAIEYGLIAALVAVGLIGALSVLGSSLKGIFTHVSTTLDAHAG